MKTSDFNYNLPKERIAQHPIEPRDHSRLMLVDRKTGKLEHRHFYDLPQYLRQGDVLVFNDSRVLPARLKGVRRETGGKVEILLLKRLEPGLWEALVKPARRLQPGEHIIIKPDIPAEIVSAGEEGIRVVRFENESGLAGAGEMPLPPYIHEKLLNPERYQTVYSREPGSAAAPTAGLHFTAELLKQLRSLGVTCLYTTLHVGLDTFRPVTEEDPRQHKIHKEYGIIDVRVAEAISKAKQEKRRVICVGTTSVRLVEQAAMVSRDAILDPYNGWVELFILPGHRFIIPDVLITNFHLPESSLLMLVSAFAGKEIIDDAYREAIAKSYRFYSFGDAMMIF